MELLKQGAGYPHFPWKQMSPRIALLFLGKPRSEQSLSPFSLKMLVSLLTTNACLIQNWACSLSQAVLHARLCSQEEGQPHQMPNPARETSQIGFPGRRGRCWKQSRAEATEEEEEEEERSHHLLSPADEMQLFFLLAW